MADAKDEAALAAEVAALQADFYQTLIVTGSAPEQSAAQGRIESLRSDIKARAARAYDQIFTQQDTDNSGTLEMNELEVVIAEFMVAQHAVLPKLVDSVRSGILSTVSKALIAETPSLASEPARLAEVMATQEPEIDQSVFGLATALSVRLKEVWEHPRKYSRQLFSQLDANGDGRITRDEFLANSKHIEELAQPDPNGADGRDPAEPPLDAFLVKPLNTGAAVGVTETAAALGASIKLDALRPKSDSVAQAPAAVSAAPRQSVSLVAAALAEAEAAVAAEEAEKRAAQRQAAAVAALGPQPAIDLSQIAAAKLKSASGEAVTVARVSSGNTPRSSLVVSATAAAPAATAAAPAAAAASGAPTDQLQRVETYASARASVSVPNAAGAAAALAEPRASLSLKNGPAATPAAGSQRPSVSGAGAVAAAPVANGAPRASVSIAAAPVVVDGAAQAQALAAPRPSVSGAQRPSILKSSAPGGAALPPGEAAPAAAAVPVPVFNLVRNAGPSRASISARAALPPPSPAAQLKLDAWDEKVNATNDAIAKMTATMEERNKSSGYVPAQPFGGYAPAPATPGQYAAPIETKTEGEAAYDRAEITKAGAIGGAAVCIIM